MTETTNVAAWLRIKNTAAIVIHRWTEERRASVLARIAKCVTAPVRGKQKAWRLSQVEEDDLIARALILQELKHRPFLDLIAEIGEREVFAVLIDALEMRGEPPGSADVAAVSDERDRLADEISDQVQIRRIDRLALARILRWEDQDPTDRPETLDEIGDECDSLLVAYLDAEAHDSKVPNRDERKRRLDRFLRALTELNAAASDAAFMLESLPEFDSLRAAVSSLHGALYPDQTTESAPAEGQIIDALRRTERRADAAIHREWLICRLGELYTRVTQRRAGRVVDAYATSEADRYGGGFHDLVRLFLQSLSDSAISQAIKRADIQNR